MTKQLDMFILGGRYTMDFDPVARTMSNVQCVEEPPDITCAHYRKGLCAEGLVASPENCMRCESYDGPSRGWGDHIKKVTDALHIPQCGRCKQTQKAMNAAKPKLEWATT